MDLPSLYFILIGLMGILTTTLLTVVMINNQQDAEFQSSQRIDMAIALSIGLSLGIGLGALLGIVFENTPTYLTIGGCVGIVFGIASSRA